MLRRNSIFLWAAIGLYIFLRAVCATQSDLWSDEVFTVLTVRQNWAEMFSIIVRDGVHPPLFYVLLKIWSAGSDSIWWLQLFPFLISIVTLVPLWLFCRELKLEVSETAVVFLAVAVNSYFLEYALDLRMYGLLQFFTLFSLWSFSRLSQSDENHRSLFLILAFFNLLFVYTHYFGWLIIGLEGLYLLIWQRRRVLSFTVSSVFVLLCFAPWFWLVWRNAARGEATGNLDWLVRPLVSDAAWFYATLNGSLNLPRTTLLNLLLFGIPVAFFIWRTIRRKTLDAAWLLLFFFAFAPLVLIFSLSYLLPKSIWETRYLIICAVPYVVLCVKSLFALPNKSIRLIFIAVICTWFIVAGIYNFSATQHKIRWSEAAEKIKAGGDANQRVYTIEDWVALPLRFYLEERKVSAQVESRADLNAVTDENFWLVFRGSNAGENYQLQKTLTGKGCRIAQENVLSDSDAGQTVTLVRAENCR